MIKKIWLMWSIVIEVRYLLYCSFSLFLCWNICVMFYFIRMFLIIERWLKWVFVKYFVLWVWKIKWLIRIIRVDVEVSKSCYGSWKFLFFKYEYEWCFDLVFILWFFVSGVCIFLLDFKLKFGCNMEYLFIMCKYM